MRRWRVIAGTAIFTFSAGIALIALCLAIRFGPTARICIASYEFNSTVVKWNASPLQITEPGYVEDRPVKLNLQFLGIHYIAASGLPGSMREIWFPYVWLFLSGGIAAFLARWVATYRGSRN